MAVLACGLGPHSYHDQCMTCICFVVFSKVAFLGLRIRQRQFCTDAKGTGGLRFKILMSSQKMFHYQNNAK